MPWEPQDKLDSFLSENFGAFPFLALGYHPLKKEKVDRHGRQSYRYVPTFRINDPRPRDLSFGRKAGKWGSARTSEWVDNESQARAIAAQSALSNLQQQLQAVDNKPERLLPSTVKTPRLRKAITNAAAARVGKRAGAKGGSQDVKSMSYSQECRRRR